MVKPDNDLQGALGAWRALTDEQRAKLGQILARGMDCAGAVQRDQCDVCAVVDAITAIAVAAAPPSTPLELVHNEHPKTHEPLCGGTGSVAVPLHHVTCLKCWVLSYGEKDARRYFAKRWGGDALRVAEAAK